jgi:DNA primase
VENNNILYGTLESVLGKGKRTSGNNHAFYCPICQHRKPKLEIDMETEQYNCWTCEPATKGRGVVSLFKKIKAPSDKIAEAKKYSKYKDKKQTTETQAVEVKLPDEYKPLTKYKTSLTAKKALNYLHNRGITEEDIIKYHIGFCETGRYRNAVIIPSYGEGGQLQYWIGRSFDKESTYKFMAPKCDKKDIIGFENHINWNVPVILTEGAFDAIAVKRNSIPLFGKRVLEGLEKKLVSPEVKTIYIALDNDALKEALQLAQKLINLGKDVYLVELEGKDPSELGFENITKLFHSAQQLTMGKLMQKRLLRLC